MADLFLNWRDIAPSTLDDGTTTTIETGGVAVDVSFSAQDAYATAFTYSADGYVEDGDNLNPNSWLKLFDDENNDGDSPTSSASLDFRATDTTLYTDQVQNVSFRINDIDALATGGDLGEANATGFEDIVSVLAYDAEGNPVSVTLTPEAGGPAVSGDTAVGTSETGFADAAGSVLVTIAGPVQRIEIQYANGDSAQQGVTISDVNFATVDVSDDNPPVAEDDSATTPEDTAVIIDVLANDSDPDGDPLTVTGATVDTGTVTVNPDNTVTYTPPADYNGPATITYTIEDPAGNSATGEVAVTVEPVNDDPVANPDTATTPEDTTIVIPDPSGNDTDPDGDPLDVTSVGTPVHGTATLNPDGTVSYTPDPDFTGDDTIPYTVDDGNGGTDTGEIIVTVTPVNDDPVANPDTATTPEDTTIVIPDPSGNDTDPDGDPLDVTSVGTPVHGTATLNPDGTVSYTPDPDFNGEDTIPYTVDDGNGGTDTGEIIVTVTPVNDDPIANPDAATTPQGTPVVISDPSANDTDPDGDPLDVTGVGTPVNGTATLNPDGTVTYTPVTGFTGEDTIPYTVDDGNGGTDTGEIIVTVTPSGSVDAVDDSDTTTPATPVVIDVLANDTDPEGDPITVTGASDGSNGTTSVNPDGTITYTPAAGFTGDDTFTYDVADGTGNVDTATVTVTVNSDPDAVDDADTTAPDTPVVIDVLGNDTDPESDPLSVTGTTDPTNGSVAVNADGTVTYTPDSGFTGEDTFDYTISDGNGGEDTATVTVTVDANGPPVANDDDVFTNVDTPVTLDPTDNDTDPDGDPLTVTGIGTPTNGTATLNPDGTVTYTPDPLFIGEDTISYTVDDGNGGTDTGEIVVTVEGRIDDDIFPVSPELQPLDPLNGSDEDPVIDDDLDSVVGSSGADTIETGDDRDTIIANGGDDSIRPGIDNDYVELGGGNDYVFDLQGADTILGGSGDDTIMAGIDTFSDYEGDDGALPILGFTSDPNKEDGRDSIQGNLGNDLIMTGDDRDTIDGGGDNDTIDAGIDDDEVMGGQGDDSIIGGHGSDTLDGGQGDDYIDGSNPAALEIPDATDPVPENDRDYINGALGNDTLIGGDDDDTLIGGSGNDVIDGGIDEDSILGGGDSDTITGGDGDDTIDGGDAPDSIDAGAGRDTLIVGSAAEGTDDTIDGGSGGFVADDTPEDGPNNDYDVLDLRGVGAKDVDWRLVNDTPDSNGNGIDGTIEFLDGDTVTGSFDFFEIEEIVPCFTPGTLIATPQGERLVEDLQEGDRIITRDNGIQEIRWVGRKDLTGHDLARKPHMKPILIRKGALGNSLPEHDMLVSPNHRVLVANDKTALYFEEREVLVAAKHLTGLEGVDEVESLGVSYIHIMFDQHEVVLSNGAWTESFQPGDYTLKGIGNAQRQEIFELFPELEQAEGLKAYGAARRSLKKHEAQLLTK